MKKFIRKFLAIALGLATIAAVVVSPVVPAVGNTEVVCADQTTGVEGFVTRLYELTLGRRPDQNGFNGWVNALNSGNSNGGECAYGFFFSDEFIAKNVPDDEYVDTLYHVFFDRNPDAAGRAGWVKVLSEGTSRLEVFNGFVNSNEWAELCAGFGIVSGGTGSAAGAANIEGITTFVRSLYRDCLGREADEAGLNAWVQKLASGEITGKEAAYGFFFSNEFFNKRVMYGSRNKFAGYMSLDEYISLYYRVFLDREPDEAGLNSWAERTLDNRYANLILFDGFADSVEFANKCARNGIIAGPHIDLEVGNSDFAKWAMSFVTGGHQWENVLEFESVGYREIREMTPHFPYVFGGLSPERGIDCSGLIVYYIKTYHGVNNVPHHMLTMARSYGVDIDPNDIQPGDLICDGVGDHGWVYLYIGRVGPDVNGRYTDYQLGGRSGDYVEGSEYGFTEWIPQISHVSVAGEDGWSANDVTVQQWATKNPQHRVARVPK